MKTIQLIVSGRVQGVCFRAYIQKQAIKLGVYGFAKNRADGTVEIIACAEQEKLDNFIGYCHQGSLMAKVSRVIVNEYDVSKKFTSFEIR